MKNALNMIQMDANLMKLAHGAKVLLYLQPVTQLKLQDHFHLLYLFAINFLRKNKIHSKTMAHGDILEK